MKVALLISGNPRTFVFKEQIIFFNNLKNKLIDEKNEVDVYIFLKILDSKENNYFISKEGLTNFRTQIKNLNPRYVKIINYFDKNYENSHRRKLYRCYYNQMKPIDILLSKANRYDNYNWFIRVRPDLYIDLEKFNFKLNKKNKNIVYTGLKTDSRGNDMFFIFSKKMYERWWCENIKNNILNHSSVHKSPEYIIFKFLNKKQICQDKNAICGLIRKYNLCQTWSFKKNNKNAYLKLKRFWMEKENFKKISYDEFEKIIKYIIIKNKNIRYSHQY